jgi:hypothetical protein
MTAIVDLPLPGDWPRRRLLLLAAAAQVLWLLLALRHLFVTGHPIEALLNALEGVGLVVAVVAAGTAYARTVRQASSLDLRFLWRGGALLTALAVLVPPFLSSDVWDYVARGYVTVLGHNPWTTTVVDVQSMHDVGQAIAPFSKRAEWPAFKMPYGPISALLQWLAALLGAPWPAVYAWKALAGAAHLGAAALVLKTARAVGSERDARRCLVLWLWNPWLLLESCGSAHNESFVALGVAATALLVARNRAFGSALAFGGAVLVKHGCAPLCVPLLAQAVWRQRRVQFLAGTLVVLAVVDACYWLWWSGPLGVDWISDQLDIGRGSLASLSGAWLGHWASRVVRTAGLASVAAVTLLAVVRSRDAQTFTRLGALTMIAFVTVFMPNFSPWYHL